MGTGFARLPGDSGGSNNHSHEFTGNGHSHEATLETGGPGFGPDMMWDANGSSSADSAFGETETADHIPFFHVLVYIKKVS